MRELIAADYREGRVLLVKARYLSRFELALLGQAARSGAVPTA
jgi:hypothetical protein